MMSIYRFTLISLVIIFTVSCQSRSIDSGFYSPTLESTIPAGSPLNTVAVTETSSRLVTPLPSLNPEAVVTEMLDYDGTLLPQPGLVYKLETDVSSYQRLWIVDENRNVRLLTYKGRDLNLSPDLNYGAYVSYGDIWLLDTETGEQVNITKTPECYEDGEFAWAPDGLKLLYFGCSPGSKLKDIYIVDLITKQAHNLTNTPEKHENLFIKWWGKQPNMIFFGSSVSNEQVQIGPLRGQCHTSGGECNFFLASIRPDGTNFKIIDNVSGVQSPPALSPNGKVLAYDGGVLYNLQTGLYQINNPSDFGISLNTPVNTDGPELVQPTWSPSGKQIIWLGHVANDSGEDTAIYLFDITSNLGKILHLYKPCYLEAVLPPWQRWTSIKVSWSPDEQFLAIISVDWGLESCRNELNIFDHEGNIIRRYDGVDFRNLIWRPDSKFILFGYYEKAIGRNIILIAGVKDRILHDLEVPVGVEVVRWGK